MKIFLSLKFVVKICAKYLQLVKLIKLFIARFLKNIFLHLLLHDNILINNVGSHREGTQIQQVYITTLGAQQQMFTRRFQTHGGYLLQLALQGLRLHLHQGTPVDLPQMQRIVVAQ